jgi:hypothetical protein
LLSSLLLLFGQDNVLWFDLSTLSLHFIELFQEKDLSNFLSDDTLLFSLLLDESLEELLLCDSN